MLRWWASWTAVAPRTSCSGCICAQKLFYDIWGDTVNVASRMESHGKPGLMQVADEVRRHLGDRYRVEDRGVMEIKNRGRMRTWFVHDPAALQAAAPRARGKAAR